MIISTKYDNAYVVCLQRIPDEAEWLASLGLKRESYAGDIASRIFELVRVQSIDLKTDYEKYFPVEFDSFAKYLYFKCRMEPKTVMKVEKQFAKSVRIHYVSSYLPLLEGEDGLAFLSKLFY